MYDFVIVGAGPAGSSAALELSKGGAKVAVVSEFQEIGRPVRCGETIPLDSLMRIGMEKGNWVRRHLKGYFMVMPNGKRVLIKEKMVLISRAIFDRDIAERSMSHGATYVMGRLVKDIKKTEKGYKVFSDKESMEARYLIGADGPVSITGDFIGAYLKKNFLCATINYARGKPDVNDEYEYIIFSKEYHLGYAYIFPGEKGEYNAGIVAKGTGISRINQNFLKKWNFEKPSYFNRSAIPLNFRMRYHAKEGVMLVGDAAGLTNSVDYGGIYAAVASGRLAGQVGLKHMSECEKEPFREYDRKIRKEPYFQKNREKEHELVYSSGEEVLNLAGELAHGRSMEEIGMLEGLSFLMRKRATKHALKLLALRKYAIRSSKA